MRNPDEEVLLPKDEFTLRLIRTEVRFYKIAPLEDFINNTLKERKVEEEKSPEKDLHCVWAEKAITEGREYNYKIENEGKTLVNTGN